jgi:hypothetical protein
LRKLVFILFLFSASLNAQILRTNPFYVSLVASEGGESTLLDGLISYWKLDETGAGADAVDEMSAHTLTNTSATTNQSGKIGTSFSFDGSTSYLGSIDATYEFTNAFSISLWFNTSTTDTEMHLLSNYYFAPSGYTIGINADNTFKARAYNVAATPTSASVNSTATVTSGAWVHAIVTFGSGYLRIYLNGSADGVSSLWSNNMAYEAQNRLRVGLRYDELFFNGLIDEVLIYNRALTESEITELFELTQPL